MAEQTWGAHVPPLAGRMIIWLSRNTPLGRGSLRKAAYRAFSSVHSGPVDCRMWGVPVRLHPQRNVSERKALLRPDQMDPAEHAAMRAALTKPRSVFVDVGGNAGIYSLSAALHAGKSTRIVMIEPDESLVARFQFNLAQARQSGRVRTGIDVDCHMVAISDHDGEGVLSAEGSEGSRSLVDEPAQTGRKVVLRTLKGLVESAGLTHIDVMKIDVEGHEDRVLPPFLATASATLWPQRMIIEHLQRKRWQTDCIADAQQRGYTIEFKTNNNTVLIRDPSPA
jgi:FkbM family methyltransferase